MGEVVALIMSIFLYFSIQNFLDDLTKVRKLEASISATISVDWNDGIPLNGLIYAHNICVDYPSLSGCGTVDSQIKDISSAVQSCQADTRSDLCKSLINVIGRHQITSILPNVDSLTLPDNPFYLSLPTRTLAAFSGRFEYRYEASRWWWQRWHNTIYLCLVLLILAISIALFVYHKRMLNQQKVLELSIQRDKEKKQERLDIENEQLIRAESIRQEKALLDIELLKIEQLARMDLANQQLAQDAIKRAAELEEKEEAAKLLRAAFNKEPTPKQEKKV